jgi:hypothetical protein
VRGLGRILLAVGIAATSVLASAGPAAHAADDTRIVLVDQDAWTPLGGDLDLRLRLDDAPTGSTLQVVAGIKISSRADFERVNDGGALGRLDDATFRVDSLGDGGGGVRILHLGLEAPFSAADLTRLSIRFEGVYPLSVELRDDEGRSLGRFVTYVVAINPTATTVTPLDVAWVWPFAAAPATVPGERADPAVAAELRPAGRLGRQAIALRNAPDVPVTLVPSPETLQVLFDLARQDNAAATTAGALRGALAGATALTAPYVPINVPSLLAAGLGDAVNAEFAQGRETLQRIVDSPVDTRTTLPR